MKEKHVYVNVPAGEINNSGFETFLSTNNKHNVHSDSSGFQLQLRLRATMNSMMFISVLIYGLIRLNGQ